MRIMNIGMTLRKSDDVQTEVRTDSVDSNSCARSELAQKPTVVIPHCMEIHDEEYWTNFRFQANRHLSWIMLLWQQVIFRLLLRS